MGVRVVENDCTKTACCDLVKVLSISRLSMAIDTPWVTGLSDNDLLCGVEDRSTKNCSSGV